ncbi:MAG TPA: alpha/beta hydrolase [Bryobacteraceae bacterium]|nr:alpha/beta hydrolase [Bryobacteraceae bacterium]
MQKETAPGADPVESCRKFWSVLREIYVADPSNADRIDWGRCELANERAFLHHWNANLLPSIMKLKLEEEAPALQTPVLTIHGRKDRSAAYGGAREWALLLPEARLVTIDEGAHAPWIEEPEKVFGAIRTFLDGAWPRDAEKVTDLQVQSASA